jgi:pyruvate/2-oxoglutarate/acetoin dehydrogenase E1 component
MGGERGYGPTHSQNLENLFIGIPNVIVYSQNIFFNEHHYLELLNFNIPVIAIENKDLYGKRADSVNLKHFNLLLGENCDLLLVNKLGNSRVLLFTYGNAVSKALDAAEILIKNNEISVDMLVISIISPLNLLPYSDLLKSKERIFLIEETNSQTGMVGLLTKTLQNLGLQIPIHLIGGRGDIGASRYSEEYAFLSTKRIVREILNHG